MRLLAMLLFPAALLAAPVPAADAEKAAKAFVEKSMATNGELKLLVNDVLAGVFPDLTFFTVRFRQWPVAMAPAEGYKASNLLVINERGEASLANIDTHLSKLLFKITAKDEKEALKVTEALAILYAELVQDGFYKFALVPESLQVMQIGQNRGVFVRMMVVEGGNGGILATVTFDATGLVKATSVGDSVKPGPRPRCQATLLLHPDSEVRAVCERNLLFLGLSAREYMMDQRARATPELQREIDRVWQRIEATGR